MVSALLSSFPLKSLIFTCFRRTRFKIVNYYFIELSNFGSLTSESGHFPPTRASSDGPGFCFWDVGWARLSLKVWDRKPAGPSSWGPGPGCKKCTRKRLNRINKLWRQLLKKISNVFIWKNRRFGFSFQTLKRAKSFKEMNSKKGKLHAKVGIIFEGFI